MNKTEMVSAIASETGVTKKDTESVLKSVFNNIAGALAKGESVQIVGFGTFEVRERAARQGLNPQTKEKIDIPAAKVPAFKAGKALKEQVR